MSERRKLPNRRKHQIIEFDYDGVRYIGGVSCFDTGEIANRSRLPARDCEAINRHLPQDQLETLKVAEGSERDVMRRWAKMIGGQYG